MLPETPSRVRVQRVHDGRVLEISRSDLRYGKDFKEHKVVKISLAERTEPGPGLVPYVRYASSSKWAVRVRILGPVAEPERPASGGALAKVFRFLLRSERPSGSDLGGAA